MVVLVLVLMLSNPKISRPVFGSVERMNPPDAHVTEGEWSPTTPDLAAESNPIPPIYNCQKISTPDSDLHSDSLGPKNNHPH